MDMIFGNRNYLILLLYNEMYWGKNWEARMEAYAKIC